MTISEQTRHELYRRLEESLGSEAVTTLMEHLPPVGWNDVATKRDLDVLEQRLRADVRSEINSAVVSQTRTFTLALVGSQATMAALVFAAANIR